MNRAREIDLLNMGVWRWKSLTFGGCNRLDNKNVRRFVGGDITL